MHPDLMKVLVTAAGALVVTVIVILIALPRGNGEVIVVDQTYSATAEGFAGEMTVTIGVADGEIVSVSVDHSDTPDYAKPAIDELTDQLIARQEADLDVVSGATGTSRGFIEAARQAVEKFRE